MNNQEKNVMEDHNELHKTLIAKFESYVGSTDEISRLMLMLIERLDTKEVVLDDDRKELLKNSRKIVTGATAHDDSTITAFNNIVKWLEKLEVRSNHLNDLLIQVKARLSGDSRITPEDVFTKLDHIKDTTGVIEKAQQILIDKLDGVLDLKEKKLSIWLRILDKAGPYIILILAAAAALMLSKAGIDVSDLKPTK